MRKQAEKIILCFAICLLFTGGCKVHRAVIEETGYYKVNPNLDLRSISSMAIAEIDNQTNYSSVCESLSRLLYSTLVKKHLFELNYMGRNSALWKQVCNTDELLDKDVAKRYRELLGCDALMVGSLTEYRPFPSVLIGLNIKIYDLRTGQVAWSLEQVWDSNDKAVENRIKRYFSRNIKSGFEPMDWEYVRTSPNAFRQFICYEIASTLPSRNYYGDRYSNNSDALGDRVLSPLRRFQSQAKKVIGLK